MNLHASLVLTPETSEGLLVAFFEEFDTRNQLAISDSIAYVDVFFEDKPPMKIVAAISKCTIKDLKFAVEGKTAPAEEVTQKEELSVPAVETTNEQEEAPAQAIETAPAEEVLPKAENNESNLDAKSELIQIAENCSSFEDFITSISTLFDFNKRAQFFANLVQAASKTQKVSWTNIEANLETKTNSYNYDKICCNRKVTEKFDGYTLLSLIKLVVQYQNFAFKQKASETTTQELANTPSMPEIPDVEKALLTLDRSLPVGNRVKHVLNNLGIAYEDEKAQNGILDLAITAMSLKEITWGNIFTKCNIPMQDTSHARMAFATFLEKCGQKIKVINFLKYLQAKIMHADEIQAL